MKTLPRECDFEIRVDPKGGQNGFSENCRTVGFAATSAWAWHFARTAIKCVCGCSSSGYSVFVIHWLDIGEAICIRINDVSSGYYHRQISTIPRSARSALAPKTRVKGSALAGSGRSPAKG